MPDTRPSAFTAASKTLNRLKARGPREVASLARGRIQEWRSSGDTLVMFVRGAAPAGPADPTLAFREATEADAVRYARDIGTDSGTSFARRLSARTHCFLVDGETLLLHASWVTTAGAWTREIEAYLVPPPGSAYIYESFTRSEARGRGIYPFALHGISEWASKEGLTEVWVAVEQHNTPSIRSVTKAGFVEAFRLSYTRRWGRVEIDDATGPRAAEARTFLSRTPPT